MKIFLTLIIAIGVFIVYVRYIEDNTIFLPSKDITVNPENLNIYYEDIYFFTEENVKLNGWFFKIANTKSVLLFLHGNAGNIGDRMDKIILFKELGMHVFIVDYRGYGKSEGESTEESMYKDAVAAYDYLLTRNDVDPDKIICYGASLGGSAAVDLATKRKLAGLIIDSSFTSAADMAKHIFPYVPSFLIRTQLDSESKIKSVISPKLFFHSIHDETVPYELGEKLFEASPGPKEFIDLTGSHNEGIFESRQTYVWGIGKFLDEHGLR